MARSYTYDIPVYIDSKKNAVKTKKLKCEGGPKGVSFYQKVTVYEHIHRNELGDQEVAAYWFQREEFALRREEYEATVNLMHTGKCLDDHYDEEAFCARGLEGRTKTGRRERKKVRAESFAIVKCEQNRQWRDAYRTSLDVRKLARVYRSTTENAERLARLMGIKDTEYVKEAWFQKAQSAPKKKTSLWGFPATAKPSSTVSKIQSNASSHRRRIGM
jgi:hypothetical protein